jgi:hypothetical protein
VNKFHGESKIVVPNEAEKAAYGTGGPFKGIIGTCFYPCPYKKCLRNEISRDAFILAQGGEESTLRATMRVNGAPVTNLTEFGDCAFLRGDHGHIWQPNANGQYEITATVHKDEEFMRFSAFIIW